VHRYNYSVPCQYHVVDRCNYSVPCQYRVVDRCNYSVPSLITWLTAALRRVSRLVDAPPGAVFVVLELVCEASDGTDVDLPPLRYRLPRP
jgi:hypothetical protein